MVASVRVRGRRVRIADDAPAHRGRALHRGRQFRHHHRRAALRRLRRGRRARGADHAHAHVQTRRETLRIFRRHRDLGVARTAAEDAQRASRHRRGRHFLVRRGRRVRQRVAVRFAEHARQVEFGLPADRQQHDLRRRHDFRRAVAAGAAVAGRGRRPRRRRRVAWVATVQSQHAHLVDHARAQPVDARRQRAVATCSVPPTPAAAAPTAGTSISRSTLHSPPT